MDSAAEQAKLTAFFAEGRRLWEQNAELVLSRHFFELWEDAHKPCPFVVEAAHLTIADQQLTFHEDGPKTVHIRWDPVEACVMLVAEGASVDDQFVLSFVDGEPVILDQPPSFHESREVTFGERLEFVYDVIAWCREQFPAQDVRDLSRRQYDAARRALAETYDGTVARVMGRLRMHDLRRLIRNAAQDMASDELSSQLMLPLDGHYGLKRTATAALPGTGHGSGGGVQLPKRTAWEVARELEFLRRAAEIQAEQEQGFIITLGDGRILRQVAEESVILQLRVDPDWPLREGDRLPVWQRGEKSAVGRLTIDLHEGDHVIARLRWHDAINAGELGERLFARPRRSPAQEMAGLLAALQQSVQSDDQPPELLSIALGCTPVQIPDAEQLTAPPAAGLDLSQERAWTRATDPAMPLVLIQGPPGTGKTHVLEAVVRSLLQAGDRVLLTAPTNAAVDNVCRRVADCAVLRLGRDAQAIAADVRADCWIGDPGVVQRFKDRRGSGGSLYAGTHVGILRDELVAADYEHNGSYDAIIFDEAGMSRLDEFLLCARRARRAILFGDHQQLPPFPLAGPALERLQAGGPATRAEWSAVTRSAMEWLTTHRGVPVQVLTASYRCQNPRLLRFASTLFYNACVRASHEADYYRLSYRERQARYPAATLRLYRTSGLPPELRGERLLLEGQRPGLNNPLEACLGTVLCETLLQRFPWNEITVIAPYRRQVRSIRRLLESRRQSGSSATARLTDEQWAQFLASRIATVDSFQGGESDAVVITYVRSSSDGGIGFVDDPNRVNVAHTRCRREMHVVGDLEHLKRGARSALFHRLERAVARDGEIVEVGESEAQVLLRDVWQESAV